MVFTISKLSRQKVCLPMNRSMLNWHFLKWIWRDILLTLLERHVLGLWGWQSNTGGPNMKMCIEPKHFCGQPWQSCTDYMTAKHRVHRLGWRVPQPRSKQNTLTTCSGYKKLLWSLYRKNYKPFTFIPPNNKFCTTMRPRGHTATVLKMGRGVAGETHKGPYVSSGQLASLLASSGHNKMHLLSLHWKTNISFSSYSPQQRSPGCPQKLSHGRSAGLSNRENLVELNLYGYNLRASLRWCCVFSPHRSQLH